MKSVEKPVLATRYTGSLNPIVEQRNQAGEDVVNDRII